MNLKITQAAREADNRPDVRGLLTMSKRGPVNGQPGRIGVLIFGIVSMPEELANIFSSMEWDQRLVTGSSLMDETLMLGIQRDPIPLAYRDEDGDQEWVEEMRKYARTMRFDQLLMQPIWRV